MKKKRKLTIVSSILCIILWHSVALCQAGHFNYSQYLFGGPHTLSVQIVSINTTTGLVQLSGVDLQRPRTSFTWEWGDGAVTTGFFPQTHTYSDKSHNYFLTVVAHYSSSSTDSVEALVRFVPPTVSPVSLPSLTSVIIPSYSVTLQSHWSAYPPPDLSFFSDDFFVSISRPTVEYLLSVAASIEMDFVNDDVFSPNGNFQQVVLRDSSAGGAYSIWYSTPVAVGAGDGMFNGTPSYSSLFHEMGHNFTLNFPGNFFYGGKIDGNANAIYSESMAQIFQHAAGYELVNNSDSYGLDSGLVFEIKQSLISSIEIVRQYYDQYVASACPFASWNDTSTASDETLGTFMTIAYEFCAQAESLNTGYRGPVKRMTKALAAFDSVMMQTYDPSINSAAADSFRATLMVSALSYAFDKDLRSEFKALKFPINDSWYDRLATHIDRNPVAAPSGFQLYQNYPNPFNPSTVISYDIAKPSHLSLIVYDLLGRQIKNLVNVDKSFGHFQVTFDASGLPSGVYFYRLQAESFVDAKKLILLK